MTPRIIFSDVDGTILDAKYQHPFTPEYLRRASACGELVLVSGRTLDELVAFSEEIGQTPDLIGENGSFIATADEVQADVLESQGVPMNREAGRYVAALSAPRAGTRARVDEVLTGVDSLTMVADELPPLMFAELSGYDLDSAMRAVRRKFSVLLHEADSLVAAQLRVCGLDATFGGRWLTVIDGSNKGRAVRAYLAAASEWLGDYESVAVGDAGNDDAMLRTVDRPFVIQRPGEGYDLALSLIPGAQLLSRPGNGGWLEMIEIFEQEAHNA